MKASHLRQGAEIVSALVRDMADEVFVALATYASVGFFTAEEGTTVFPEYEQYRDRPECQGQSVPRSVSRAKRFGPEPGSAIESTCASV